MAQQSAFGSESARAVSQSAQSARQIRRLWGKDAAQNLMRCQACCDSRRYGGGGGSGAQRQHWGARVRQPQAKLHRKRLRSDHEGSGPNAPGT